MSTSITSRVQAGNAATLRALEEKVSALPEDATPEQVKALGQKLWLTDVQLHDFALGDADLRRLAKLLPGDLGQQLVSAWQQAKNEPLSAVGARLLNERQRGVEIDGQKVTVSIGPKAAKHELPAMLVAAYGAHPREQIDLVLEHGATMQSFPGSGKAGALPAASQQALLSGLQARHHGVKDVGVQDGAVVVKVGHRFNTAFAGAVDRLVKRDVGNVPVRLVVDNQGDQPLASRLRGIEVAYQPDGTRSPTLTPVQSREMTARFADLGVLAIAAWAVDGTFIQVKHGTTPEQAQKILAAVQEHLPTDYACVYSSDKAANRPYASDPTKPPQITADLVLAGRTDFIGSEPGSLPQFKRDAFDGLR